MIERLKISTSVLVIRGRFEHARCTSASPLSSDNLEFRPICPTSAITIYRPAIRAIDDCSKLTKSFALCQFGLPPELLRCSSATANADPVESQLSKRVDTRIV